MTALVSAAYQPSHVMGGRTARWVAYIFLFTPARQTFRPSEEIKTLFNGRYLWWKTANMQNLVGKGRWAHWGKGAGSPYILRWVQFCFIRWLKKTISRESKTVSNIPRMISQKLKQLYSVKTHESKRWSDCAIIGKYQKECESQFSRGR